MRIYYSPNGGDPLIAGSLAELNALASTLPGLIASSSSDVVLETEKDASPGNYEMVLPALILRQCSGPLMITLEPKQGLTVAGSRENLLRWCSYFRFRPETEEGDHHHPESADVEGYVQAGSLGTIIEVFEPD